MGNHLPLAYGKSIPLIYNMLENFFHLRLCIGKKIGQIEFPGQFFGIGIYNDLNVVIYYVSKFLTGIKVAGPW